MARLILLIKRTGSKKFIGGIPTKPRATVSQLKKLISQQTRKGFVVKIITVSQFNRLRRATAKRRNVRIKVIRRKKRR